MPKSVPQLDQIGILPHPTPTKFAIKNGPEIVNFRPVLSFLAALANHRLQPLGHLTAARKLSINEIELYGLSNVLAIVPEIVPANAQNRCGVATLWCV